MECACVYCDIEDSRSSVVTIKIVTARKTHKCGECGCKIKSGAKYENVKGLWDGEWSTCKTCSDCLSIRNEFFCEGWYYGQVLEYLQEHIRESDGMISSDCILSLTSIAQDCVFDMIENVWSSKHE